MTASRLIDTSAIYDQIASGVAHERQHHTLHASLQTAYRTLNLTVEEAHFEHLVAYAIEYVCQIPRYLIAITRAARDTGYESYISGIVNVCTTYWDDPNDYIPDSIGLLGILDDAYITLRLLHTVSDNCKRHSGIALLTDDLSEPNRIARSIIGDPFAAHLDEYVARIVQAPSTQEAVAAFTRLVNASPLKFLANLSTILNSSPASFGYKPITPTMRASDEALLRLGTMGIFPGRRR